LQELVPILSGIIIFGLLHGINPSHGWTIAVLYALQSKRPLLSSILSSSIIASAHFLSSIVVVLAFILFSSYIYIPQNYLNYAAAIALGILAFLFWKEKTEEDLVKNQHGHLHHHFSKEVKHDHIHWHKNEGNHRHLHTHQIRILPSISALAISALILGFAHEEEFVILSLAVGGINPVLLMIVYTLSVSIALISITILSVKVITTAIQDKIIHYTKYLPKVSAVILAIMAIAFGLGLI
jgi:ABC-type nickel/cobalt efflux system permease component RcnA